MNNDMFKSGNKIPMNISKTPMVETMYVKDDHPPFLVLQKSTPMENFKTSILGLTYFY